MKIEKREPKGISLQVRQFLDRSKPVKQYAKEKKITKQAVYKAIHEGRLEYFTHYDNVYIVLQLHHLLLLHKFQQLYRAKILLLHF